MAAGITGLAQTAVAALLPTEPILESKFHAGWSEPVREKIARGLAIALVASGAVVPPIAPFSEAVQESKWHQPWSEPVRIRPALPTGEQHVFEFDPLPFTKIDWFGALSEAVRRKPGLATTAQQTLAQPPWPDIHVAWFQWWSEPIVKARPRLIEAAQQWLAFNPPFNAGAVQSEWSGPPPSLIRFQYQAQARPPWPDINIAWLPPLAEPARARPALPVFEQHVSPFDEDIIFVDRWFVWWSEPVRARPALFAGSQQILAFDPQPFPFLGGGGGWYLPGSAEATPGEPDPTRRRIKNPGAPRKVEPKVEPRTFADVLGSQQPARLADVLGAAFAQRLGQLVPPAFDLYVPPARAIAPVRQPPPPAAIDAIADHVDALDAAEALHALDELDRQEREFLISAILAHFAKQT